MVNNKTLVSELISQHRNLQKEVGAITGYLEVSPVNAEGIARDLAQFRIDLMEHLGIENDYFYVELLKAMKEKGQDTSKTEQFIAEMVGIGKVVTTFLDKYKDASVIQDKTDEFVEEFGKIAETLTLRIESEEAGVYSYWGLF